MDDLAAILNGATGFEFSIHGWIALTVGSLATIGLNGGLMWLVIASHRKGFDADADAGLSMDGGNTNAERKGQNIKGPDSKG